MAPTLTELITSASWRQAITYRHTQPDENVLTEKDNQQELLDTICEHFRTGEGVARRFFAWKTPTCLSATTSTG